MRRFLGSWALSAACFVGSALLFGCASGASDTDASGTQTGGEGGKHPSTGSKVSDGGGGNGGGGPLTGQLDVCVINAGDPGDPCQKPAKLDFGNVDGGVATTRTFAVINDTNAASSITDAKIMSNDFKIVAVRYEDDPGMPGSQLRVVQSLPAPRSPGQELYFEVTWLSSGPSGALPADQVVVSATVAGSAVPELVVPMIGANDGCPAGTDACDDDATNGCETNTDTDVHHCGSCDNDCGAGDSVSTNYECDHGICKIAACNAGFGDCNTDKTDGCETNLLNTVDNCGACGKDCRKANTNAFCDGGNCNITGCAVGYEDCNHDPSDGCETQTMGDDKTNCGACGKLCDLAGAGEFCQSGVCRLGACDDDQRDCDGDESNGCETNTKTDKDHCGSCSHACAYDNADSSCVNSQCQLGACDFGFLDCDLNQATGCEVNGNTDPNHCGGCAINCGLLFPGSQTTCQNGICHNDGCSPNHYDLDGNGSCEYVCTFQSATDDPGDDFVDENCDGIDGDAALAIFVAKSGSDSNPGTRALPMLTVNGGLGKALSQNKTQVYVSKGTYNERVLLANGVSIFGGYDSTNKWSRSDVNDTIILQNAVDGGHIAAVEGTNISQDTILDRLIIKTGNASGAGVSNYGLHCSGCSGVTLKNSTVTAGTGGGGTNGTSGSAGANGFDGTPGQNGSCDGSNGTGGPGGSLFCNGVNVSGARGGNGGAEGNNGGAAGGTGANGGSTGGNGGNGCDSGCFGGCSGKAGSTASAAGSASGAGTNGGAGSGGSLIGGYWTANGGGTGATGSHGRGGGGGGGGGGQGGCAVDDGGGNGGGGGGSGGCGGTGATGGSGGGGSFGIFLVNSTGFVITTNDITSGNGGNGGAAGNGGGGGSKGFGAGGAQTCTGEVGGGGNGGNGADGGRGGHGGGGAGGVSYAIYRSGTTLTTAGNTLAHGTGGAGGTSSGNTGGTGAAANVF